MTRPSLIFFVIVCVNHHSCFNLTANVNRNDLPIQVIDSLHPQSWMTPCCKKLYYSRFQKRILDKFSKFSKSRTSHVKVVSSRSKVGVIFINFAHERVLIWQRSYCEIYAWFTRSYSFFEGEKMFIMKISLIVQGIITDE